MFIRRREIKFDDEQKIFRLVYHAVLNTPTSQSEVREVTSSDSVEEVNAWVNEKRRERFRRFSQKIIDFVTALVNAVYFKAAWEKEFSGAGYERRGFL